jgi:hypothetical protein
MDLSHKQHTPTPKSPTWWLSTLVLLSLGIWQRLLKSGMHLGFYGLQALCPTAAAKLASLQQRHQPPWKNIGHAPSGVGSRERSEGAKERQRSSIDGSAGQGLVEGAAAVQGAVKELASAYA